MKQKILVILILSIVFITLTSGIMNDSGRAGYTGSPGETTCNTNSCHNSFTLNSGGGSITATSNMNNWTYEPFTTYTINIKIVKAGLPLFGIGVEILSSTNANAGTIVATDALHTQIQTRLVNAVNRQNLVHKLNGGRSQDSITFTFNWISPDVASGNVTLYFVGNASNNNGSRLGDFIYNSSQVITASAGDKINEISSVDPFSVYPNPANNNVSLHYTLPKKEPVTVKLYDMRGALVYLLMKEDRSSGVNNDNLLLPSDCKNGIYILTIESASGRQSIKLMVN